MLELGMADAEVVNLRDFVYLDVERVKSLLAQMDRGLLSERADASGSSASLEGKAGFNIPALAQVGGGGQYVSTDNATETRTLHDFVYNQTEERLLELNRIKRLPEDFSEEHILSEEVRTALSPVEYVLVRGQIALNDHGYMMSLLEKINDVQATTTRLAFQNRLSAAEGVEKSQITREMEASIKESELDEKYVRNLKKWFDWFIPRDRVVLKIRPFPDDPTISIVGPLQSTLLRERLEDIRYKYGSAPAAEWTVFGQIAAVPIAGESHATWEGTSSNALDNALDTVFDAFRGVEDHLRVTFPEIAITPIAVYRD